MGGGVPGVLLDRLLEECDRLLLRRLVRLASMEPAEQIKIVGFEISAARKGAGRVAVRTYGAGDLVRNVLLNGEDVSLVAIVDLRPRIS